MKHPYDGGVNIFVVLLGLIAVLFGGMLMLSIFFPSPPEIPGMSSTLSVGGGFVFAFGAVMLWDAWNKTFRRPQIHHNEPESAASLSDIANRYWVQTFRRKVDESEIVGDSINGNGGCYHLERETGQMYKGYPVVYSVWVDRYGEVVASGYHLPLLGIS